MTGISWSSRPDNAPVIRAWTIRDHNRVQSATPSAVVSPFTSSCPHRSVVLQADKLGKMGVDKVLCVTVDDPAKVADLASKLGATGDSRVSKCNGADGLLGNSTLLTRLWV